jgi:hypothetical protein
MPPLVDLATLRSLVQTDVGDTALQILEDAAEQEIIDRWGANYPDPITVLRERLDLSLQTVNWIYLERRISPATANASFTTNLAGANNDILFASMVPGAGGNQITISFVVAGLNTPLSVTVNGFAIIVNVATNGAGAPTSTAAQVIAALTASASASNLVAVANAPANDGTGVVAALAATPLAGGVGGIVSITEKWGDEFSESTSLLTPNDYRIHYNGGALERLGNGQNPRWLFGHRVTIVYTPEDDTKRRKEVITEVVRLAVRHSGVQAQSIGNTSETSYASYVNERRELVESLGAGMAFS